MNHRCVHRWAFPAWGQDLQLREDELPALQGREVRVRVTHCGLCHSDLHIQAGGFDMVAASCRRWNAAPASSCR